MPCIEGLDVHSAGGRYKKQREEGSPPLILLADNIINSVLVHALRHMNHQHRRLKAGQILCQ